MGTVARLEADVPIYAYRCEACEIDFDRMLPISKYDEPQACETCGEVAKKLVSAVHFNLSGDDWPSKNERIKKQMAAKNKTLTVKQNERQREQPHVKLVPNVGGERVESWGEAKKLAESQGKDTSTYDPLVKKEAALKK